MIVAISLAIPVANAYVINSNAIAAVVGATTDGSLIYAFGADSQGAIFVFDAFKLINVYHLEGADWIYDAQYYNGYLYAIGNNGLISMINVNNWQVSRQVNVGYTPTSIEKIGDQFYVTGYLYNETTGRYDTYMSIYDLNLNLADEKVLQVYEYGGFIPLDISWNTTHVAIVGYTIDVYTGNIYPVVAYWDPSVGNYSYTIYTDIIGYGTSVDVCNNVFAIALGSRILYNNTFYSVAANVTDVMCYNGLIWFAYNEDGAIEGNATTVVHVGYINVSDNSITDVVAGYGRVYGYGDPVVYGNSVLFGGAAYCPLCTSEYPSVAALYLIDPLDYVIEVRTSIVTATVTTTTTKTVTETETQILIEAETETVTETTTATEVGTTVTDIVIAAILTLLFLIVICTVLTRRK